MRIKSIIIIDNTHYINFITFNISTLFFSWICPSEIGVRLICRKYGIFCEQLYGCKYFIIINYKINNYISAIIWNKQL